MDFGQYRPIGPGSGGAASGGGGGSGFTPANGNLVWYVAPIFDGTIVPGSGYTGGLYQNVPLTGGSGSGATADIAVDSFALTVTDVVPRFGGSGYIVGDVLSAAPASIGGTGSGFTYTLTSVGIGNDNNDGLTPATPFGSIQHAAIVASQFNYQFFFTPTINLAAGKYQQTSQQLVLPELRNCPNGGVLAGASTFTSIIFGSTAASVPVIQTFGADAAWFINTLTVDGQYCAEPSADSFVQFGDCAFTDTHTTGNFNPLSVQSGGTIAVAGNCDLLKPIDIFINGTPPGGATIQVVGATITLAAGSYGNAWIRPVNSPTNIFYLRNTVINAGNFIGAQFVSDIGLVTASTDNGTPEDFPGDRTLNSVNTGTVFSFFNADTQSEQASQGIWKNPNGLPGLTTANSIAGPTADIASGFGQLSKDSTQTNVGKGIGLFIRELDTIKSITPETARVATQFDKTNDAVLANIPGLTINVGAGYTYQINATLFTTSAVNTGVKAAVAGTCTATAIIYEAETISATSIAAHSRATALAISVGGVTAVTAARIDIKGLITVNAAGTLTIQFAENVAVAATTSSVLVGSYMSVQQIA